MQRLHIAMLDEELPYPLTSGKRIRSFNLLRRLAMRHRLTWVAHRNADASEVDDAARVMQQYGIRTIVVDRVVPPKSGLGFYARLAWNLTSPFPYSVTSHRSPQLVAAMQQLASEDPVDLWQCEWTPYLASIRDAFGEQLPPTVVMAQNVESLIWKRMAEAESNPAKRWYIREQYRKFDRFEKWAYSQAAMSVAVSDEDATLMRTRYAGRQVAVVDNGVDVAFFQPGPLTERDPYRLLFLGSLDWRPNVDAIQVLLEQVFPAVLAQEPRARLEIVGRQPSPQLRQQVAGMAGVSLFADVADVRPYLARAGRLVVPLRIGGGSRLKILESLATSTPVVTTKVGVEGLHLEDQQHVTVADTPQAMATAIVAGMRSTKALQLQAARGRQRVLERYDWDPLAQRLEQIWFQTLGISAGGTNAPPVLAEVA
ncbi:glycosyltransferase [Tuwongella immobilis]|uniref:Uncharacterized protein n=1 Tax=Tuwongella immobilis TaxID=692036 RepID=A0A6C2YIQ3_9BACT|nr:glycosyltransferase [Tuwongella immobilis]VIP01129.1 Glycosyl transferase group 1 OS=Isosphaera pallida (strain ATCC 43644 / DSM 9630 / IS1B) GN=Isop_3197 PE=4 SV=1: Glyco_trans_1_4 [Tuwongella immobilis]VTR97683.1 Glycosyl transferase group 1 OS=Isosphaera pallida (strain ATCC 43644 / DSM 9630 / IS1B) GN=Isop_3197 PE=4 SV=1: Glyco_trans_1_4 [Tuwongella immobilis]